MEKLSILVPAFNEAAQIGELLNQIASVELKFGLRKEIVVINDGSTDDTARIVRAFRAAHPELDFLFLSWHVNLGKGASLRAALAEASGDLVVIQDADLEYNPSDYNPMLTALVEQSADVVYGTRFASGRKVTGFVHRLANWFLTGFSNLWTGLRLTDVHTCLKLFRAELLRQIPLHENGFGFCPEVTAKLAKLPRLRLVEVPVSYRPRHTSEGKKVGVADGLWALWCSLRYSWSEFYPAVITQEAPASRRGPSNEPSTVHTVQCSAGERSTLLDRPMFQRRPGTINIKRRLALSKAVYLLSLLTALAFWGDCELGRFYSATQRWPREGKPLFASHFATWDAAHYLYLSEVGYARGVASCAFYPLWPLLVRGAAALLGGSHLVTGTVLANVLSLVAGLVFHRVVEERWGRRTANWALVWLVVFPGALFFQFNYSESLFLLLVMILWWALEKHSYGWAALAALALPLTRAVGVFSVLPIAWHCAHPAAPWLKARVRRALGVLGSRGGRQPRGAESAFSSTADLDDLPVFPFREVRRRLWLLTTPLLGWGAYLTLMCHWTGNPFEGFEAQKHWAVHSISNLWDVPKLVAELATPTEWHAFTGSVLDRCVFILLLYCLPVLWRLDRGLLVWVYVLGILPAMSGTFTSFTRFASCVFPMFIALAVGLSAPSWRRLRYGLLAVFATLHLVLLWRFVNFRWAG